MECRQVERILDAYVACELPVDAAGEVREHLDSCPSCSESAARYAAALEALGEAGGPAPVVDASFYRTLSARLDRATGPRPAVPPVRWYFVGSVAAAAASVLIAAVYLVPSLDPIDIPSGQPGEERSPAVVSARPNIVLMDTSGIGGAAYPSPTGGKSAYVPGVGQVYFTSASTDGSRTSAQFPHSTSPFDVPRIYIRSSPVHFNPFFQASDFATAGEYRKLEGRLDGMQQQLKTIETRLTSLESQGAPAAPR